MHALLVMMKNVVMEPAEKAVDPADLSIIPLYLLVPKGIKAVGKFAVCWHARHRKTGKEYAAKIVKKRRRGKAIKPEVIHEIAVLESCSHSPYIVNLYEVYEDDAEMVLILELATGGELQQLCDDDDDIEEEDVRRIIEQTLVGVLELHRLNIVHLDIKPSNILLASKREQNADFAIKLCDFGISRVISAGNEVREILGTPDYVAPEVLNFDPISTATDLWSIGVLAYVLLTGISPFAGEDNQETYVNINQNNVEYPEEMFGDISPGAVDFIKRLLVKNPKDRMTIENCQRHPWIAAAGTTPRKPSLASQSQQLQQQEAQVPNLSPVASPVSVQQCPADPVQQHSEIKIQILPARITVTDDHGNREEITTATQQVSSPPMRRPHQVTSAEKENSGVEALTKRFKYREPPLQLASPSSVVSRRASIGSPVHSRRCTCGKQVDENGHHGLSCKFSSSRHSHHFSLNDVLKRALVSASVPAIRELPSMVRQDGKRPDGMNMIPWKQDKALVWDTVAPSHIGGSIASAGRVVNEQAPNISGLEGRFIFSPVAFETFGVRGKEAKG
ncbi:Serine/threonine-protein kinase 17A [Hypsibius exemplaris]|uniref:non-specific serine/threonine protein kinase n=1 Tax=Hypsibius exemplaris TaxID=2072580 RepID=A0A9X6RLF7_HYPEX|nr:Serine/threonine-protein kinase 17A [Hypsibius exemplaris]